MAQTGNISNTSKIILILLLGAITILFPISLPRGAGDWDLQAYWSSAYLFAHGQDFSNPIALGEIEHTLTTRDDPETSVFMVLAYWKRGPTAIHTNPLHKSSLLLANPQHYHSIL